MSSVFVGLRRSLFDAIRSIISITQADRRGTKSQQMKTRMADIKKNVLPSNSNQHPRSFIVSSCSFNSTDPDFSYKTVYDLANAKLVSSIWHTAGSFWTIAETSYKLLLLFCKVNQSLALYVRRASPRLVDYFKQAAFDVLLILICAYFCSTMIYVDKDLNKYLL